MILEFITYFNPVYSHRIEKESKLYLSAMYTVCIVKWDSQKETLLVVTAVYRSTHGKKLVGANRRIILKWIISKQYEM
jgi:hypothetical protein